MAIHAKLYVADSLSQAQIDAVAKRFVDLLREPIDFDVKRDKTLIGGFRATINGTVYDASISTRIKHAKEWLLATDGNQ